jgi:hypothetical protein
MTAEAATGVHDLPLIQFYVDQILCVIYAVFQQIQSGQQVLSLIQAQRHSVEVRSANELQDHTKHGEAQKEHNIPAYGSSPRCSQPPLCCVDPQQDWGHGG